jgi:trans-aconitate 2-methyltransferase
MTDWNAEVYHRVSEPQFQWGLKVLESLKLGGDETVLDAGCGTGRLTELLAARLPRGHVIAADVSEAMIAKARQTLAPLGAKVSFRIADLELLTLEQVCDVVFSTATFHWIKDHDALFGGLRDALRPRGRLHAQCGGAGNLQRAIASARLVAAKGPWAEALKGFEDTWHFANVEDTRRRLKAAGFEVQRVELIDAPTPFATPEAYKEFVGAVVLRHFVARLPEDLKNPFLDAVTERALADAPKLTLDYVRLEIRATR